MSFEPFVALRFLNAKRRIGLISFISIISIAGITVGVWALIVVLSVFNGFNSFAIEQLVGFDPHLRITPTTATTLNSDSLISLLDIPGMISASPFIEGRSAIIHEGVTQVAEIRGVNRSDQKKDSPSGINYSPLKPSGRSILLGGLLASKMKVGMGDQVSIISRRGLELALTQVAQPTTITVQVAGTFSLNQEYDSHVAFTDLETARELFDIQEGTMGIEVRLENYEEAEAESILLQGRLGENYRVETWQDLHRDLYGAMQLERWAAFAIVMLIVIVAVFNVLGSLTMTVIEKQRDIGVMKAMGAGDRSILRIFLYEGGLIGIIGTVTGLFLGIGSVLVQQTYEIISLNTDSYLLPAVPVEMHWQDILLVAGTALLLATLAAVYPARRAARILPADAVRWE
ncbi:MAG: FtsX-like permease family protein [Candidatus Kapaibacterium sp.]